VTGTGAQAARNLRMMGRRLPLAIYRAEQQALREAKAEAQRLSTGPYQPRTLAALGHPYARRRFQPPLPPWIINRVTGRFYRGWRIDGPRRNGTGGYISRLFNIAPEAAFLTAAGTKRMGPRPLPERIAARLALRRGELVSRAVQSALSPGGSPTPSGGRRMGSSRGGSELGRVLRFARQVAGLFLAFEE
jgi:hypothetical protein